MILMRLVWIQLRDYRIEANYRSLSSIAFVPLVYPDECQFSNEKGISRDDAGLSDFVAMKDIEHRSDYAWLVSLGFMQIIRQNCEGLDLTGNLRDLLRTNQWILYICIISMIVMVRVLSRSWVLAIIGAAVLLSRGHLVGNLSDIGIDNWLMLFVSLWFVSIVIFFRTGSFKALLGGIFFAFLGTMIDSVLAVLPGVLSVLLLMGFLMRFYLMRPVLQRFRLQKRQFLETMRAGGIRLYEGGVVSGVMATFVNWIIQKQKISPDFNIRSKLNAAEQGHLFGSLPEPFALWIFQSGRWLKIVIWGLAGMIACVFGIGLSWLFKTKWFLSSDFFDSITLNSYFETLMIWYQVWGRGLVEPIDLHYGISLAILIMCAFQSPALGLANLFETAWLLLSALLFCIAGAFFLDWFDLLIIAHIEGALGSWSVLSWSRAAKVLVWFEPAVLSFAIVGFYQLILVGDHRRHLN